MLIAEEVGRAAGPGAYAASAVIAAVALAGASDAPLGKEILPELAAGRTRIGVALAEAHGARDGAGVRLERGVASGTALFALDAVDADRLLVHTANGLALFAADAPGVEVVPLVAVDRTRRIAEIRLRSAEPIGVLARRRSARSPPAGSRWPSTRSALRSARSSSRSPTPRSASSSAA